MTCVQTYLLLSPLRDLLVCFEERADVDGLTTPEMSVDGPVEGELEGATVELASGVSATASEPMAGRTLLTGCGSWSPYWEVVVGLRPGHSRWSAVFAPG